MRHRITGGRLAGRHGLAVRRLWEWVEKEAAEQKAAVGQMLAERRPEHLERRVLAERMANGLAVLLERRIEITPAFLALAEALERPALAEADDLARAACRCLHSLVEAVAEFGQEGLRELSGARKAQSDLNRKAAKRARDLAALLTEMQRLAEGLHHLDCYPVQALAPHHLMLAAGWNHGQFMARGGQVLADELTREQAADAARARQALAGAVAKHWRPAHWPSMPDVLNELATQLEAHEVRPSGEAATAASGNVGAAGVLRHVLDLLEEGEPGGWPPIWLGEGVVAALVSALDLQPVGSPSSAQVGMARSEVRRLRAAARLEQLELESRNGGEDDDINIAFTVDAP